MSDDYEQLAPIYDALGMADFAASITPPLLDYAQSHDWVGRRAVDLGCGTGASVQWLANRGYNITGIDHSPSMLRQAQQSISGSGIGFQLYEGDIRSLSNLHDIDLALALDVVNELNSLRDLETAIASVARILVPGKLFIFDLHTIGGLARLDQTTAVIHDDLNLTAVVSHRFDYDRQVDIAEYITFQRSGSAWQRRQVTRTMRGFPIQVVTALLQRAGFGIMAMLNDRLETVDPATQHEPRIVILARRAGVETD
ncbi:MAG: methyltransferase domain-containing protein [Anaerolineae bacterium]|nr:methyltransferase domain-containing protein [Anaerolineae bacterium]